MPAVKMSNSGQTLSFAVYMRSGRYDFACAHPRAHRSTASPMYMVILKCLAIFPLNHGAGAGCGVPDVPAP